MGKLSKIHEIMSKMGPKSVQKVSIFVKISKNGHFRHFSRNPALNAGLFRESVNSDSSKRALKSGDFRKTVIFSKNSDFSQNCTFRQNPLGLDKGFGHFSHCTFTKNSGFLDTFWSFSQKPRGLDRGL